MIIVFTKLGYSGFSRFWYFIYSISFVLVAMCQLDISTNTCMDMDIGYGYISCGKT